MDTCLGFSKASSFAYIGCYCIVTVLLETMAFLGCYHDCRFSNVSTWHLQKLALSKDVCARDFAQVACKDSSMIAVVLWPKLGLAACLRIIGDNNFPSLNSYLSTSDSQPAQTFHWNIYPASHPHTYFNSAFSWRQMLKSSASQSVRLAKEYFQQSCVEFKKTMRGTLWLPACADYLE